MDLEAVAGVNLDEEAANMMRYQQAYQAASKIIAVSDELFRTLLEHCPLIMRISSKTLQLQWLADVYRRQAELARVQQQVSTGLRISTAADDPAGAGQVVALRQGTRPPGELSAPTARRHAGACHSRKTRWINSATH